MAQVQLTTDVKNFQRASLTAVTGSAVPVKVVTATQPVSGSGSVVLGSSLNYLKLKLHSDSTAGLTVSVFGWSYYSENRTWVPQLLATLTTTQGTTGQTIPGIDVTPQYEVSSYVLTSGDAKIYNSPGTATAGAFVLIDTLGAQFVEVYATASASTPVVYAWTSGL
tara:strand:+ start:11248 stop:11745 length:498 start_codon:yes stop_codon:yes gene_type:complete